MSIFRAVARAAAFVAILLSTPALVRAADVSYLTHWAPETVAKLEADAAIYQKSHPGTR